MEPKADIRKAAAIIIKDRKLLISRSKDKAFFVSPGGKLEGNETYEDALIRELKEEQGIVVTADNLTALGTFYSVAAGHEAENLTLEMKVFFVVSFEGELAPRAEIDENKWVDSSWASTGIQLSTIFAHDVIPALKERNLID